MLINRYFKHQKLIMYHISSSIWIGINRSFSFLEEHIRWKVDNGKDVDLWIDNLLGYKIKDLHLVLLVYIQFMQITMVNSII